jgi:hypothetical protein
MRRLALILAMVLTARAASAATARLTLDPVMAHLGDAIRARIAVEAGAGETIDVSPLPIEWGGAQVLAGAWEPATPGATTRVWSGTIAAYQLGAVEVPPVVIPVMKDGKPDSVATEAATLTIEATLPPGKTEGKEPDLMDLKPPASIPADFGPLKVAAVAFSVLVLAALLAWWLWRRYAAKLAAVGAPVDPFRRLPPHVWVYEELEKLLARRLAEEGRIGVFYDELTRIVKQYLEGRSGRLSGGPPRSRCSGCGRAVRRRIPRPYPARVRRPREVRAQKRRPRRMPRRRRGGLPAGRHHEAAGSAA